MFDWEIYEPNEYSRLPEISFVNLTTRNYLTLSGEIESDYDDAEFMKKAASVQKLASFISQAEAVNLEIPNFKSYRPYPVQAVWKNGRYYKICIKQPNFITEDIYNQAIELTSLMFPVKFERLAEGMEIQTVSKGPLVRNSPTLAKLIEAASEAGVTLKNPNIHREVYLDGLPVSPDQEILIRLEIDPKGKIPEFDAIN